MQEGAFFGKRKPPPAPSPKKSIKAGFVILSKPICPSKGRKMIPFEGLVGIHPPAPNRFLFGEGFGPPFLKEGPFLRSSYKHSPSPLQTGISLSQIGFFSGGCGNLFSLGKEVPASFKIRKGTARRAGPCRPCARNHTAGTPRRSARARPSPARSARSAPA